MATPRKQSGCLLSSNKRPINTTRFPSSTASQMRSATCGADSSRGKVTARIGVTSGGLSRFLSAMPTEKGPPLVPVRKEKGREGESPSLNWAATADGLLLLFRISLSLPTVPCASRVKKGKSGSEGSSVSCSSAAPPCKLRSTSNNRRRIIRSRSADVRFSRARNAETMFEKTERKEERPGRPRYATNQ